MSEFPADIEHLLRALATRHVGTLRHEARGLHALVAGLCCAPSAAERAKLLLLAHKLKGSSRTLGFLAVGDAAAAVETLVEVPRETLAGADTRSALFTAARHLVAEADRARPEDSSLLVRIPQATNPA